MKLDRNGYRPSLFNTEDGFCYIHKADCVTTVRHEIFGGPYRQISKKYGLWINVCPECHNIGSHSIHSNPENYTFLKVKAQILFEQEYTDEDFITIFGRNYVEE